MQRCPQAGEVKRWQQKGKNKIGEWAVGRVVVVGLCVFVLEKPARLLEQPFRQSSLLTKGHMKRINIP